MSKHYSEPYDPILRTSDHGSKIYSAWRSVRKHPHYEAWESYPVFYAWAMDSGYTLGARLRLIDESKPYCPENCMWFEQSECTYKFSDLKVWADNWNKTVNRIRKHYGMPLLGDDKHG